MFGKGGGVDQPDTFADGAGFIHRILPPAAAPKTARIVVKAVWRIQRAEIIRPLKPVDTAKLRAARFLPVIGRRGAQRAAGFALFVRVVQDIDVLIAFFVFARRIFGGHPTAVAFGIKRGHVDLGLALDHHLRQIIAGAASGGDAKAKAFGEPHIAQARGRTHQRIAIGCVTDRPVVVVFQPHGFRRGNAVDHRHIFFFDPFQIERKEIGAETVGHAVLEPRWRVALVGAEDPAAALFAHIPFGICIAQHRVLAIGFAPFHQRRIRFGDDKLMLDRNGRGFNAQQFGGALRMIARGGDHMFGMDHDLFIRSHQIAALFNHFCQRDFPFAAGPFIGVGLPFTLDRHAALARAFGHRHGDIGRIDIAIGRMINRAHQILGSNQRIAFFDLRWAEPFIGHAAGLGRGGIDHIFIHPLFGLRHAQIANDGKSGIKPGFGFELFIELDRILMDMGCGKGHVKERQQTRCMPGRSRGQLIAL